MEVSLRQLARQQHLVISRAQAYGHGESERRVQTRLRRGEWVQLLPELWRGLRKDVAVNGWIWHSRREQFQRDHDTAAWLRLDHGIEILPVTARDCIHATPGTVARVLRFLGC